MCLDLSKLRRPILRQPAVARALPAGKPWVMPPPSFSSEIRLS